MRKTDEYRLQRITEIGKQLTQVITEEGITSTTLLSNYKHQWLVTTPLYNIGEQVYCLSPAFKDAHPDIEWSGIAGLRHRLVHDYEGTNWSLIAEIVKDDLSRFLGQVQELIGKQG